MAEESEEPRNLEEPLMNLSNLGRTIDGTGLAYRSLDCPSMRIGNIKAIDVYSHLNHIDLSRNYIKDVAPLRGLQFVLTLNLSFNEIKDLKPWVQAEGEENEVFPQLLHLDVSNNLMQALPGLQMKALRTASFKHNDIMSCEAFSAGHPTLRELDLSECRLQTLTGVANCPSLTKLDVSNQREILPPEPVIVKGKPVQQEEPKELPPPGIQDIAGLTELPALTELNVSGNRIAALSTTVEDQVKNTWQDLPTLQTIDLSANQLSEAKPLEALRTLPKLRSLKVAKNPFTEAETEVPGGARTDVLICHWRLAELDGQPVTPEELDQAKEENVRRLIEERERKKAEEEAAAAAEAEGAGGE